MGGVGKTALATVLAHRLKDRYPDAQLFLNLRGADPEHRPPVPPAEAMQSVIRAFHPEARLPETLEALAPIYRSALTEAGRVLLVLDNAADAEQVRALVPPANCLLLVTSRAQFTLPGLATRNLDCLPPDKSQELLLRLAPSVKGHAAEAAELCGHLPLAVVAFAGAVNDKSLTPVSELVERLRARRDKLASVEAAFEVSYELLSERLRSRWRQLTVFPTSFDLRAAAAVWGEGVEPARDAMQALVNANVVEWNQENGRFRLHDLVRQFCEGRLGEGEGDTVRLRHAKHYRTVGAEAETLYLRGGENVARGLELFDRERGHLEAAFEWLCGQRDRESAAVLVSLVGTAVNVSELRLHPRRRIQWLEAQREAARSAGDRRGEGDALGNLGLAYAALGDPRKAIGFWERCLRLHREVHDRRGEGNSLGNLGMAYADLGDARKAIEFHTQALVIDREIGDFRGEAADLGNLGRAYADLGDAPKAVEFFKQGLKLHRRIGDRRGEGAGLCNLGLAYAAQKAARKAVEFFEQGLVIAREIGDRRGETNALGNLGSAYVDLGEVRKAIEFFEQALAIAREIGDRRGEGAGLGNLGVAYAALCETRKAIKFHEQSLVVEREIGNRRGEGGALFNLALGLHQLGDRKQAIAHAEAALHILEAVEDLHAARVRAHLTQWREKG